MADYILKAEHIKKSFGGVHALKGVSIALKKGEIHCLAGENGCGKSTLIKIISGYYTPDEGSFELHGRTYGKISPVQAIDAGVQVIYQDLSLFPNLTVMENLALNMERSSKRKIVSWKRFEQIAKEALGKINVSLDLYELVENLSVASRQIIAICRALLSDAKLIIMDEPTTALTTKEIKALFEIIRKLQAQGISILFVSHKLDEVFEISERYTILRSGENVATGDTSELDQKKFAYYMTGKNFDDTEPLFELDTEDVVMQVKDLSLKNGFKDVSFDLRRGEILGITGLLGSGRTELAQAIFGYRKAEAGSIALEGQPVKIDSVHKAMMQGIGYVPEDRLTEGLFLIQSIKRNMLITKWDEFSNLFGFLSGEKMQKESEKWIENLSVAAKFPELPVQTLSGGNQQKVVLSRWLALQLKVLILNGPTVGVDIGAKYDIHRIIRDLAKSGMSVIMISDDLPEVLENCHRVIVMREGRLVGEWATKDVTNKMLAEIAVGGE